MDKKTIELYLQMKEVAIKHSTAPELIYALVDVYQTELPMDNDVFRVRFHMAVCELWNKPNFKTEEEKYALLASVGAADTELGWAKYRSLVEEGHLTNEDFMMVLTAPFTLEPDPKRDLGAVLYEKQVIQKLLDKYSENSLSAVIKKYLYNDIIPIADQLKDEMNKQKRKMGITGKNIHPKKKKRK
jgi:hypothetical protein